MLQAAWSAWQTWRGQRRRERIQAVLQRRAISDALWQSTIASLPFVARLPGEDLAHLRLLASLFLDRKEFSGAQGLVVSDAHALMVAVQACLPILRIAPRDRPDLALAWYDGFVGIVLHAGEVKARREWVDEDGIAHSGSELLTGEIMEGGPLMLAWSDVQAAGDFASEGYNVVIHEFIHVIDMQSGQADGCPSMPADQRKAWKTVLSQEYEAFREAIQLWQRFGSLSEAPQPVIDPYGSESIEEFFAVAAEAYFVQRERFAEQHPKLLEQFDRFFKLSPAAYESLGEALDLK